MSYQTSLRILSQMTLIKQSFFNWSSGKDSALALHYALQSSDIEVGYLFSVVDYNTNRIGMHEIPSTLLESQAEAIRIPLRIFSTGFDSSYADGMKKEMNFFQRARDSHLYFRRYIFG
nr:hypothetical protein [Bacteroides sp.]